MRRISRVEHERKQRSGRWQRASLASALWAAGTGTDRRRGFGTANLQPWKVEGRAGRGTQEARWCPGDPDPAGRPIPWDGNVCHDFYWDSAGVHDIGTGTFRDVLALIDKWAAGANFDNLGVTQLGQTYLLDLGVNAIERASL